MKQAKWSEEQIIGILKQVEGGRPVAEVCREHSVSQATYYKWNAPRGYPVRWNGSQRGTAT